MVNFRYAVRTSPHLKWVILLNISLVTFMSTLNSSIVNVALPTISEAFHAGLTLVQWIVTAYLLTLCGLLPIFGRLADMVGRKKVYLAGLAVFTLGSALCGIVSNIWLLITMRIFQGIGAAAINSCSQPLIAIVFPKHERGKAIGLLGTTVAFGSLMGPGIGGLILEWAHWPLIFFISVPIGIIALVAAQLFLPQDVTSQVKEKFDVLGGIFFILGMVCLLLSTTYLRGFSWASLQTFLIFLTLGAISLFAFFLTERKVANPMVDFSLYRNRPFLIGNITSIFSYGCVASSTVLLPFYLQQIAAYPAAWVGLLMMANPLAMALVAPFSGSLSDRFGSWVLTTGGLMTTSLGLFYLASVENSAFIEILIGPLLIGVGAGMFNAPNTASVMSSVSHDKLGIAGGLNALVRNIGLVLGTSLAVSLFTGYQNALLGQVAPTHEQAVNAFLSAFHAVMVMGGILALIGAIISLNRKGYRELRGISGTKLEDI